MLGESAFLDRRTLLAGLGIGAAAAATPGFARGLAADAQAGPASWLGATFSSLQAAGLSEWRAAVGETFAVKSPNGSHELRVVAVTAFPESGSRPATLGRSQAFSVVFEAIAGPPLPATDSLYRLVHRAYPPLPVYMGAPSGLGPSSSLIAVFN
jgi:hypothetical protein